MDNQPNPPEHDVLTLEEGAEYLRCHPKTLRKQAVAGLIPGRRVGYLWRFSRKRLEAWMEEDAA